MRLTSFAALILAGPFLATPVLAAESVNIYSARHYDSDELLYNGFEEATGIEVNVIEADGPTLVGRLKAEGANSPADIFLTVDAGSLWLAEKENLFQPISTPALTGNVPASLRDPADLWYGFATRVRLIFVNPDRVDPALVQTYESLADPRLRGQVCMRTSSQVYNLSLMGAMIERLGAAGAEDWARGVVANFAREPQGNDTGQILSVAAGECGVTIANHYYYLRLKRSQNPQEVAATANVVPVFPNQDGVGTHVNISGAGVLAHAPHKEAAIRFLEYLASPAAQEIFVSASDEFPALSSVPLPADLAGLGEFKRDPVNVSVYGENQTEAQMIYDRAGWN